MKNIIVAMAISIFDVMGTSVQNLTNRAGTSICPAMDIEIPIPMIIHIMKIYGVIIFFHVKCLSFF